MTNPEDWLVTHRAPPGLVEAALRAHRAPSRPPPRRRWAVLVPLAVGLVLGWVGHGLSRPDPLTIEAQARDLVPVRLVLHAPDAEHVAVAGTFNGWDPAATPMIRADDGTFYVIVPLEPGRYEYLFVVDGERWLLDPAAPLTQPDDFGSRNAILEV